MGALIETKWVEPFPRTRRRLARQRIIRTGPRPAAHPLLPRPGISPSLRCKKVSELAFKIQAAQDNLLRIQAQRPPVVEPTEETP